MNKIKAFMAKRKEVKKEKQKDGFRLIVRQLPHAINYLSDLFVFLIVLTWVFYIVNATVAGWYELIANQSSSIMSDLKDACTIPLTVGGVTWLLRCALNHMGARKSDGKALAKDFPNPTDGGDNDPPEESSTRGEGADPDNNEETTSEENVDTITLDSGDSHIEEPDIDDLPDDLFTNNPDIDNDEYFVDNDTEVDDATEDCFDQMDEYDDQPESDMPEDEMEEVIDNDDADVEEDDDEEESEETGIMGVPYKDDPDVDDNGIAG